jgi:hypothetical protein
VVGVGHKDTYRIFSFIKSHHNSCVFSDNPVEGCGIAIDLELANSLQHLKGRLYWTHVWTIQEIVVATNVRVMSGTQSVEWLCFTHFLRLLSYRHLWLPQELALDQMQDHALTFSILHLRDWPRASIDVAQALNWSASSLAADSRDKVYALLGLVTAALGTEILPDYNHPPYTVYCIAIRAIFGDWRREHIIGIDSTPGEFLNFLPDSNAHRYIAILRKDIKTIPQSCVDDARRCEMTGNLTMLRPAWLQLRQVILSAFRNAPRNSIKTNGFGCDGLKCESLVVLRNAARWHELQIDIGTPSMNSFNRRNGLEDDDRVEPPTDAHSFFTSAEHVVPQEKSSAGRR